MYKCVHIYMYTCTYICMNIYLYSNLYLCHMYGWEECVQFYRQMYVFIYMYKCVHIYAYMYAYTYIYMYTYLYSHLYLCHMYGWKGMCTVL
jgi:hypothetical protein